MLCDLIDAALPIGTLSEAFSAGFSFDLLDDPQALDRCWRLETASWEGHLAHPGSQFGRARA